MPQHPVHDLLDRDMLLHAAPATTVQQAAQSMAEHRCGSLLVGEDEQLVGIFTAHDLLTRVIAKGRDPKQTRLHEVMTPDPATITAATPVRMQALQGSDFLAALTGGGGQALAASHEVAAERLQRAAPEDTPRT